MHTHHGDMLSLDSCLMLLGKAKTTKALDILAKQWPNNMSKQLGLCIKAQRRYGSNDRQLANYRIYAHKILPLTTFPSLY